MTVWPPQVIGRRCRPPPPRCPTKLAATQRRARSLASPASMPPPPFSGIAVIDGAVRRQPCRLVAGGSPVGVRHWDSCPPPVSQPGGSSSNVPSCLGNVIGHRPAPAPSRWWPRCRPHGQRAVGCLACTQVTVSRVARRRAGARQPDYRRASPFECHRRRRRRRHCVRRCERDGEPPRAARRGRRSASRRPGRAAALAPALPRPRRSAGRSRRTCRWPWAVIVASRHRHRRAAGRDVGRQAACR